MHAWSHALTDVTRGDVLHVADVAVQLGHEGLAEAHHLRVALALGIEVGAGDKGAKRGRKGGDGHGFEDLG